MFSIPVLLVFDGESFSDMGILFTKTGKALLIIFMLAFRDFFAFSISILSSSLEGILSEY